MSASERPHDTGGPQPENQRKRAEIRGPRHALVGVLAVTALAAVAIGIMIVQRADGRSAGLPPDLLAGAPFGFRGLGLLLVIGVGAIHAAAAVLLVLDHARGRHLALLAGGLALACAIVLVMTMTRTSWLQPALFGVGLLELLLVAGSTPRTTGIGKQRMRRR